MPPSQPGTAFPLGKLLIPLATAAGMQMFSFDPTNFNDPNIGSFYYWKVEDVACGRTPSINRVLISYRDLGPATITVALTGTNDLQQVIVNANVLNIGNTVFTGKIMTVDAGVTSQTAQNLQLSVTRAANGGPVSITKVRMEGRVEMTVYG
jgi:hypothetical protein